MAAKIIADHICVSVGSGDEGGNVRCANRRDSAGRWPQPARVQLHRIVDTHNL